MPQAVNQPLLKSSSTGYTIVPAGLNTCPLHWRPLIALKLQSSTRYMDPFKIAIQSQPIAITKPMIQTSRASTQFVRQRQGE